MHVFCKNTLISTHCVLLLCIPFANISVWDQFRLGGGGGLKSLARIFSPALAQKYDLFLPENGH